MLATNLCAKGLLGVQHHDRRWGRRPCPRHQAGHPEVTQELPPRGFLRLMETLSLTKPTDHTWQ